MQFSTVFKIHFCSTKISSFYVIYGIHDSPSSVLISEINKFIIDYNYDIYNNNNL